MPALTPLSAGPMRQADALRLAAVLKAIADPTRLQLIALLSECNSYTSELSDEIGTPKQPTVSHHLTVLRAAGLVERRTADGCAWHSLTLSGFAAVADALAPGGAR